MKEKYDNAKSAVNDYEKFKFDDQTWLDTVKKDIETYGDFSYDIDRDALYQQYKDKYIQQGKLAMGDAIGQASSMTGGYGNSYAQSVGQQAYQNQLDNLNDIVPELYQMALDKHNMGLDNLYNQYGLLSSEYDREYGLHQDEYSKLLDQLGIAKDDYYYELENNSGDSVVRNDYDNGGLSDSQVKEMQRALGITADGMWGSNSKSAAGGLSAAEAWNKYRKGLLGDHKESGGRDTGHEIDDNINPTQSSATDAFVDYVQTKSEYLAKGHNEKKWLEYIEGKIQSFMNSDRLTDSEALYLIEYYGLE